MSAAQQYIVVANFDPTTVDPRQNTIKEMNYISLFLFEEIQKITIFSSISFERRCNVL